MPRCRPAQAHTHDTRTSAPPTSASSPQELLPYLDDLLSPRERCTALLNDAHMLGALIGSAARQVRRGKGEARAAAGGGLEEWYGVCGMLGGGSAHRLGGGAGKHAGGWKE